MSSEQVDHQPMLPCRFVEEPVSRELSQAKLMIIVAARSGAATPVEALRRNTGSEVLDHLCESLNHAIDVITQLGREKDHDVR